MGDTLSTSHFIDEGDYILLCSMFTLQDDRGPQMNAEEVEES